MKPITLELLNDGKVHYRAVITPGNPVTTCEIQRQAEPVHNNCWTIAYYGMSICKHGDTYDLETGCRLALKSVLRKPKNWQHAASKEFRAAAWKAYLQRFPVSERTNPERDRAAQYAHMTKVITEALCRRLERDMVLPTRSNVNPFGGTVSWGVDHAKVTK